ncbi:hypothetical protein AVEN_54596-1 [Araneus ventricosus]|uniref:Uncharacterized protein n=1 Tax=Araneus ventricosus TaxID=182803 RepID=A0A4Y2BP26_ARAVE|nr:hypothetical protein AVEN_54596-1 [Araneus ventricosus]
MSGKASFDQDFFSASVPHFSILILSSQKEKMRSREARLDQNLPRATTLQDEWQSPLAEHCVPEVYVRCFCIMSFILSNSFHSMKIIGIQKTVSSPDKQPFGLYSIRWKEGLRSNHQTKHSTVESPYNAIAWFQLKNSL